MSNGSMAMTPKEKPSLPNGSHLSLHVRRRGSRSNVKVMLSFYYEGAVQHEYALPSQTITKDYYIEVLRRLRDAVKKRRLWASGDWHHDNAPAHSSLVDFFGKTLHHLGLSAPTDQIWLPATSGFSRNWNSRWMGISQTANEIKESATKQLMAIPKKDFSDCFEKRNERWGVWGPKGSTLKGTKIPF